MSLLAFADAVDIGGGRGRLARPAAASLARVDARFRSVFGRAADINEAWRSPEQADANFRAYQAWLAYQAGRGPKVPWAPIGYAAKDSIHCRGYALDTDDTSDAQMRIWNDHGWFWTVYRNGKLVERWHLEYDASRDNHRHEPAPAGAATTPRRPSGDEPMYIQALTQGTYAKKGNVYVNDIQGHWRGITNLEFEAVKQLVGSGLAVITAFDGSDLDLMFAVSGVWEQPQIDSNAAPRWGKAPGTPLMGLGALTGRLMYPGNSEWHYPRTAQAPGVDLAEDET
jgi:hypothetical protein